MKNFKKDIRISTISGLVLIVLGIVTCSNKSESNAKETTTSSIRHIILQGTPEHSPSSHSGWINLNKPFDFNNGDALNIRVQGTTAKRVLIRLLPVGGDPTTPVGVVEAAGYPVVNGEVNIRLTSNYSKITQISVHGGLNPFGVFPLPQNTANDIVIVQQVTVH